MAALVVEAQSIAGAFTPNNFSLTLKHLNNTADISWTGRKKIGARTHAEDAFSRLIKDP